MKKFIIALICFIFFVIIINSFVDGFSGTFFKDDSFYILSNPDNQEFMNELIEYGDDNDIDIVVEYADDLESLDILESSQYYDAVWMSNSIWLYMLNNVNIVNSKSVSINPVVMGIKKSKAESLGFVDNDIYNKDIVEAIKNGKLKYVMTSVTKTNTGLTAYLGFLNSLAGSPEILSSKDLKNQSLISDLKALFSGVERVSGTNTFLEDMFLKSNDYEAVIASESSLININKELTKSNKEPLYLLYPTDGVAINDSPFAYVDRGQDKLDEFNILQSYLLSNETQKALANLGKRTWYGGINNNIDTKVFNKSWGIDTTKYLIPLKYPSKKVMDEALVLYIDELRKPSNVVFCLDYSGSMYGDGKEELSEAMSFILNREEASKEKLQFSAKDKITVIPFSDRLSSKYESNGINTSDMIYRINNMKPNGGTNIYACVEEGLRLLKDVSNDYTKTIILMTDGESNSGSLSDVANYYNYNKLNIPVYSIMFGNADSSQLENIADLTNAKVFDGRTNLMRAFKEVRSYN